MALPQTTREYRLPKADGIHCLTLQESPIPKLKSLEVLLKVHAVSLQVRSSHPALLIRHALLTAAPFPSTAYSSAISSLRRVSTR